MTAWMIEQKVMGVPHWLGLYPGEVLWSSDPDSGLRFAREVDAKRFMAFYNLPHDKYVATEHEWPEVTP
jgi:hypothetical protein